MDTATPAQQPSSFLDGILSELGVQTAKSFDSSSGTNAGVVSLDDESVRHGEWDFYKGRKGVTDRIAILLPQHIQWARTHYIEEGEKKGYFQCQSTFEVVGKGKDASEVMRSQAPCCAKFGVPKKRFSAMVVHYATDQHGKLTSPLQYVCKVWRLGEATYAQLRGVVAEWPTEKHDLQITCADENFQRLTIMACKESVINHPSFSADKKAEIVTWTRGVVPRLDVTVGRKATAEEWSELVGAPAVAAGGAGTLPPGVGAPATVTDLADLLK